MTTKENHQWPIVNYNRNEQQPHFLFIITPPYSGSTAISELINSSPRTMTLHPKGEGQWLIPGLCDNDRWSRDKIINLESIKSVWLNKYQTLNNKKGNIDLIIEKSPPNMIRIKEIATIFDSYSFIANNRNPYAQCSSILYRHYEADTLSDKKRLTVLKEWADKWLNRSQIIKELIHELNIPLITYENFCKSPASLIDTLQIPNDIKATINPEATVRVKDYAPQKIINQNERQISKLNQQEIDFLSGIFNQQIDLLHFYDYCL